MWRGGLGAMVVSLQQNVMVCMGETEQTFNRKRVGFPEEGGETLARVNH